MSKTEKMEFNVFNKLQELQTLIKKESSLKQLCKISIKSNYNLFFYFSSQHT